MKRSLLVGSMMCVALAGCSKGGNEEALANDAATNTSTVQVTGSAASIGTYGPGEVATPKFVEQAAISDMYEIGAAKLALAKSKSAPIKAFAQDMITAHTAISAQLKDTLAKSGVAAPLPTALDDRHAKLMEDLQKAEPDKFDARYLDQQTQAHREALGLMDSYATHGDNAALKSFAAETMPKIQSHLETVSKLDHSGADNQSKKSGTGG